MLLALAAPALGLRLGFPDAGNNPADTTTRQAYDLISEGFGPGANGPLLVTADLARPGSAADLGELERRLRAEEGVAFVVPPRLSPAGDAAILMVIPESAPQDAATQDLVDRLRADLPAETAGGARLLVGGTTAAFVDQSELVTDRLPLFIAGVVGLSFLLLLVAFRAPVMALKAGLMNLLSVGAAYGVVALVAEGGWAGSLLGIDEETPVAPFIPVMMFAILFGLSMDYEVFLLSRVREEFLRHGDSGRAVVEGLARTARVITAAAAIMVVVFLAFLAARGLPQADGDRDGHGDPRGRDDRADGAGAGGHAAAGPRQLVAPRLARPAPAPARRGDGRAGRHGAVAAGDPPPGRRAGRGVELRCVSQRRLARLTARRIDRAGGMITPAIAVQIVGLYTMTAVLIGALVMWLVDDENFPNYGVALWWAAQTVTTVGYGDVVPTNVAGRIVASLVMFTGIALISVVSGAAASGLMQTVRRRQGMDTETQILEEIEKLHRRPRRAGGAAPGRTVMRFLRRRRPVVPAREARAAVAEIAPGRARAPVRGAALAAVAGPDVVADCGHRRDPRRPRLDPRHHLVDRRAGGRGRGRGRGLLAGRRLARPPPRAARRRRRADAPRPRSPSPSGSSCSWSAGSSSSPRRSRPRPTRP